MVIEKFRTSAEPIYERYRAQGRLAPPGLRYIDSWVAADMTCCYQLMECENRSLLNEWMEEWDDLVEFEVVPVLSSGDVTAQFAKRIEDTEGAD